MPLEPIGDNYFDTAQRAERLQLLLHLLRNTDDAIYLRAPSGAGKTRFAHRLLDILGSDTATVWIRGGTDTDLVDAAVDQLGLTIGELADWPGLVFSALGDQDLLVVVDDADVLAPQAIVQLAALHARGGRVLLLGHGALAQPQVDWELRYVDLPAFDPDQSMDFLRSFSDGDAAAVTNDLAAALHHAAHGLPGPLLDGLNEVMKRRANKTTGDRAAEPPAAVRSRWPWVAGGVVVVLLLALLVFQDPINALFEQGRQATGDTREAMLSPGSSAEDDSARPPASLAVPAPLPPITLPELSSRRPQPEVIEPSSLEESMSESPSKPGGSTQADVPTTNPETASPVDPAAATSSRDPASAPGLPEPDDLATVGPTTAGPEEGAANAMPAIESPDRPQLPGDTASGPPDSPPVSPLAAALAESEGVVVVPLTEYATVRPKPAESPPPETADPQSAPQKPAAAPAGKVVAPEPAASKPVVASAPPTAAKRPSPAPAGGMGWLRSRRPAHYTLQLVGARDRASVEKFIRRFGIGQPYAIFERQLDGRPWYSLVAGDYPDRAAAVSARERLAPGLARSGVWPRTFESIQGSL